MKFMPGCLLCTTITVWHASVRYHYRGRERGTTCCNAYFLIAAELSGNEIHAGMSVVYGEYGISSAPVSERNIRYPECRSSLKDSSRLGQDHRYIQSRFLRIRFPYFWNPEKSHGRCFVRLGTIMVSSVTENIFSWRHWPSCFTMCWIY